VQSRGAIVKGFRFFSVTVSLLLIFFYFILPVRSKHYAFLFFIFFFLFFYLSVRYAPKSFVVYAVLARCLHFSIIISQKVVRQRAGEYVSINRALKECF